MEDPLQHPRDKECVKYYFHSLQVFYMQDEEVDDLLDHINKSQGTYRSARLLEDTCEKRSCCHDIA